MTKGRMYVTIDSDNNLEFISYYDKSTKRFKQIDLDCPHKGISPHTHHRYEHNENDGSRGAARLTNMERKMVDRVKRIWYNKNNKS